MGVWGLCGTGESAEYAYCKVCKELRVFAKSGFIVIAIKNR
jgi:hypothetical protein